MDYPDTPFQTAIQNVEPLNQMFSTSTCVSCCDGEPEEGKGVNMLE